jgi:predicted dinucleotide-binding enzyme
MKFAVLGTGTVGQALAGRLDELGHQVALGTRDPEATRGRTGEGEPGAWLSAHDGVAVATFADAAAGAEVVVFAGNGAAALEILGSAGAGNLDGKVLVDVSNPLDFSGGFPPRLFVKDDDSLAEQIQRAFPGARVVKTLNTMNASVMVHPDQLPEGTTVFVSGDDADAKSVVAELLRSFGHTDVVDLGDLGTARGAEMYVAFWVRAMGALGTPAFNVKVVR